jgi:hypothetical protein
MFSRLRDDSFIKSLIDVVDDQIGMVVIFSATDVTFERLYHLRVHAIDADELLRMVLLERYGAFASRHQLWWRLYSMGSAVHPTSTCVVFRSERDKLDEQYILRYKWKIAENDADLDYIIDSTAQLPVFTNVKSTRFSDFPVVSHAVGYLAPIVSIARRRLGTTKGYKQRSRFTAIQHDHPMAVEAHESIQTYGAAIVNNRIVDVSGHLLSMLLLDVVHLTCGNKCSYTPRFLSHVRSMYQIARSKPSSRIIRQIAPLVTETTSAAIQYPWHTISEYKAAVTLFEQEWGPTPQSIEARQILHGMRKIADGLPTITDLRLLRDLQFGAELHIPTSVLNETYKRARRGKLVVAVSGSGKSHFTNNVPGWIDADVIFKFPNKHRWWEDAKLALETNVTNAYRLQHALMNSAAVFTYSEDLSEYALLWADAVVAVAPNQLARNLMGRGRTEETGQPDSTALPALLQKQAVLIEKYAKYGRVFNSFSAVDQMVYDGIQRPFFLYGSSRAQYDKETTGRLLSLEMPNLMVLVDGATEEIYHKFSHMIQLNQPQGIHARQGVFNGIPFQADTNENLIAILDDDYVLLSHREGQRAAPDRPSSNMTLLNTILDDM